MFEEGARPLLFIMVDQKDTPPAWLPGYEIRVNLEDYGIDEAVVVVKRRLEELGATVREETLPSGRSAAPNSRHSRKNLSAYVVARKASCK